MGARERLSGRQAVVIIGGGGYARETLELISQVSSLNHTLQVLGFVANHPPQFTCRITAQYSYLGTDHEFIARGYEADVVLAIGDPHTRERLANVYEAAGYHSLSLTHPTAVIGESSRLARGVIISAFACITADVQVGHHVHIDRAAQVGHGCQISDFVTIHPAATLAGDVRLGECAVVGTSATVLPGIKVGAHSTVGAGAVVTTHVKPGTKVAGVPARVLA